MTHQTPDMTASPQKLARWAWRTISGFGSTRRMYLATSGTARIPDQQILKAGDSYSIDISDEHAALIESLPDILNALSDAAQRLEYAEREVATGGLIGPYARWSSEAMDVVTRSLSRCDGLHDDSRNMVSESWLSARGFVCSEIRTYWYPAVYGEVDGPWLIKHSGGFHLKIGSVSVTETARVIDVVLACELFKIDLSWDIQSSASQSPSEHDNWIRNDAPYA